MTQVATKGANYKNGVLKGGISGAKSTWSVRAARKIWKLLMTFVNLGFDEQ